MAVLLLQLPHTSSVDGSSLYSASFCLMTTGLRSNSLLAAVYPAKIELHALLSVTKLIQEAMAQLQTSANRSCGDLSYCLMMAADLFGQILAVTVVQQGVTVSAQSWAVQLPCKSSGWQQLHAA